MDSTRHPNQLRSACERCRKQKLRCMRDASGPCVRCERLSMLCEAGLPRKVGRPVKKDVVLVRTRTKSPVDEMSLLRTQTPYDSSTSSDSGIMVLDDLDWTMPNSPFDFTSIQINESLLPIPLIHDLPPPDSALTLTTPDTHFHTLSKINMDLHSCWDAITHSTKPMNLDTLLAGICKPNCEGGAGLKAMQIIMQGNQEFLVTIRALHKKMLSQLSEMDPTTAIIGSSVIVDSPTAYLIISILSQLISHYEFIYTIVNTHLSAPDQVRIGAGDFSFADIPLLDFAGQAAVFTELARMCMMQSLSIIGFPAAAIGRGILSRRNARGPRIGLLAGERWRGALNGELGGEIKAGWTTRPDQMMEMLDVSKELIMDFALMDV